MQLLCNSMKLNVDLRILLKSISFQPFSRGVFVAIEGRKNEENNAINCFFSAREHARPTRDNEGSKCYYMIDFIIYTCASSTI